MNKERTNTANKKQRLSACTEAYKEHIMYTFNAFCRVVIRYATLNSWRDRSRKRQREISFEYLTEEKFYPFSTSNKYFIDPYEQYPITICGQTVILTNGELAAALLSLPEKKEKSFISTFSVITRNRKLVKCMDVAGVRHGITYTVLYKCYKKKWRCFRMKNPNLIPYEIIVRATNGEPEAVDEVLRHYSKRIRIASLENGHVNKDTEDNIKRRLIAALFQFRFDEQPYPKTE